MPAVAVIVAAYYIALNYHSKYYTQEKKQKFLKKLLIKVYTMRTSPSHTSITRHNRGL